MLSSDGRGLRKQSRENCPDNGKKHNHRQNLFGRAHIAKDLAGPGFNFGSASMPQDESIAHGASVGLVMVVRNHNHDMRSGP